MGYHGIISGWIWGQPLCDLTIPKKRAHLTSLKVCGTFLLFQDPEHVRTWQLRGAGMTDFSGQWIVLIYSKPWWDCVWLVVWNMFFPCIGNNHPNWLSYFSDGLKPPTSIWIPHTSHSSTRPIKLHNFNHVISKNHFHMDPRYQSWFPVIFTLSGYITIKPKTCIICVYTHIYIYVDLIPTVSKVVSFQLMFLRQVLVWQKLQFGAYVSLFCHTGLTKLLINFEVLPAACPEKLGCHCFTTQKIICKSTVKMPVQPAVWLLVFSKDVCVCCRS